MCFQYFAFDFNESPAMIFDKMITLRVSDITYIYIRFEKNTRSVHVMLEVVIAA